MSDRETPPASWWGNDEEDDHDVPQGGNVLFDHLTKVDGILYHVFREDKYAKIEIFFYDGDSCKDIRDMIPPALAATIIESARGEKDFGLHHREK